MVTFISIAYLVVKLKIFRNFWYQFSIHEMVLVFFWLLLPLIWFNFNENFMPKLNSAKYAEKKGRISSPFSWKNMWVHFAIFGLFLAGNRACSQVRGSETKFDIFYFTHMVFEILSYCNKSLVSALSNFTAIGFKGHFLKNFTQIFMFGCFSQYHAHSFYKNNFNFLMQSLMLNWFM